MAVKFWRDGKEQSTKVKIGELEQAEEDGLIGTTSKSDGPEGFKIDSVGLELKPMSEAIRNEYGISPSVTGVFISSIIPGSEADKKDLQEGIVIIEINQQPVTDPKEIAETISKAQQNARKSVLLLVNDAGSVRFVALRLPRSE